jgi:hypothetical protein
MATWRAPDIGYLLRQGHLGGEEGELASLSVGNGDPDGGHAVRGSVVYVPCPNGVTAIKVSPKVPHLKRLWTDNDGAAGSPIIADGLVWTIEGDNACREVHADLGESLGTRFRGNVTVKQLRVPITAPSGRTARPTCWPRLWPCASVSGSFFERRRGRQQFAERRRERAKRTP